MRISSIVAALAMGLVFVGCGRNEEPARSPGTQQTNGEVRGEEGRQGEEQWRQQGEEEWRQQQQQGEEEWRQQQQQGEDQWQEQRDRMDEDMGTDPGTYPSDPGTQQDPGMSPDQGTSPGTGTGTDPQSPGTQSPGTQSPGTGEPGMEPGQPGTGSGTEGDMDRPVPNPELDEEQY